MMKRAFAGVALAMVMAVPAFAEAPNNSGTTEANQQAYGSSYGYNRDYSAPRGYYVEPGYGYGSFAYEDSWNGHRSYGRSGYHRSHDPDPNVRMSIERNRGMLNAD